MFNITKTDDGVTITDKITYTVREEFDRFIFQSIEPYLTDIIKIVISKEILVRALTCFAHEHPEELKHLQEKIAEEDINTKGESNNDLS